MNDLLPKIAGFMLVVAPLMLTLPRYAVQHEATLSGQDEPDGRGARGRRPPLTSGEGR